MVMTSQILFQKHATSFRYAVNVNEKGYISLSSCRGDWGDLIFTYFSQLNR